MTPSTPIPMEMTGWSMAPWLRPGDLLLIDSALPPGGPSVGDIVVLRRRGSDDRIVHRVVAVAEGGSPFQTKGDRNREKDPSDPSWEWEGKVTRRYRDGIWRTLHWNRFAWFLSVAGLYPGQRIPVWLSCSAFRKRWVCRAGS